MYEANYLPDVSNNSPTNNGGEMYEANYLPDVSNTIPLQTMEEKCMKQTTYLMSVTRFPYKQWRRNV